MANDYTIKMGWDGSDALSGVDKLEQKIETLAKKTSEIGKTAKAQKGAAPRRTNTGQSEESKRASEIALMKKRNLLIARATDRIQALTMAGQRLDMGSKDAEKMRKELARVKQEVIDYRTRVQNMQHVTKTSVEHQTGAFRRLNREVRQTTQNVTLANKQLKATAAIGSRIKSSFIGASAAMFGAYAVFQGVGLIVDNAKEWENLNVQMQAAFGSAEKGAEKLEFVKQKAFELGSPVKILADGYGKIAIAAESASLTVEDTEEIFLAAAEASRAFGLTADDTNGVIKAFSQILGKGKVSTEELRQQLGERMVNAMGVYAESMGITVPKLFEMVEAGEVASSTMVGFAKTLRQNVRESGAYQASLETMEAKQQRFMTTISMIGDSFAGGALAEGIKLGMDALSQFFKETEGFWELIGDALGTILVAGVKLIKTVLAPVRLLLGQIGQIYQALKDTSLVNTDDINKLTTIAKIFRIITGLGVDAFRIFSGVFSILDHLITKATSGDLFKMMNTLSGNLFFNPESSEGIPASVPLMAAGNGGSTTYNHNGDVVINSAKGESQAEFNKKVERSPLFADVTSLPAGALT